jgi:hypothetical protein
MTILAAVLIPLLALQGAAIGGPVRCDYASRIDCTSTGCAAAPVDGYLRIPKASTLLASSSSLPAIDVCTAAGCTPIAVRAARSGIFLNLAQDGGAHFVKIALADAGGRSAIRKGDFVEVAAQFLSTVTHVGRCPAVVD